MRFHVTWHQANANAILRNSAITFCGSRASTPSLAGCWSSGGNNGIESGRVPSRLWLTWVDARNMCVNSGVSQSADEQSRVNPKIKWDSFLRFSSLSLRSALVGWNLGDEVDVSMERSHVEVDDDEEDSGGGSSSSDESSSSSDNHCAPIHYHFYTDENDGSPEEQRQVKNWTLQIPIGLGLCPWASKSHNQGNLRYVTCALETPRDVAVYVQREIQRLVCRSSDSELPQWSTTLVICPNVNEWIESFPTFDKFVSNNIWEESEHTARDEITLVAFHPNFIRWHGLPENITKGTVVQSHYGIVGKKSVETAPATIVETCNKAFGMRKVKVRFQNEETIENAACHARRQEQYVPTDWISLEEGGNIRRLVLPDNAMHQAPHPTIHIINNTDLANLSIRDISRVKRKNAQRMMRLGWDGIEKKLNFISTNIQQDTGA